MARKRILYDSVAEPVFTPTPPVPPMDSWFVAMDDPPPRNRRHEPHDFGVLQITETEFAPAPAVTPLQWLGDFADRERKRKPFVRPAQEEWWDWLIPTDLYGTENQTTDRWAPEWHEQWPDARSRKFQNADLFHVITIESSGFAPRLPYEWFVPWADSEPNRSLLRLPVSEIDKAEFPWFFPRGADQLRFYFSGASSDGAAQADPDASLGGFRSSTEAKRVGVMTVAMISGLTANLASRRNGADGAVGDLQAVNNDYVRYTAPGSNTQGPRVHVPLGQTRIVYDGEDASKWVRVTRSASGSLAGFGAVEFVEQFHNVFGMLNLDATTGGSRYRAVFLRNEGLASIHNVKLWVGTLADQASSSQGQLAASGGGTIAGDQDAFCGWPRTGWARIQTSAGTLREIVYYSSRTDSALTVPAGGRGRLGTSAAAGAATDIVFPVPGIRLAFEAASPRYQGSVQTIANESTAPTGLTWSTAISAGAGINVGTLHTFEQGVLWIHRETPAGATATGKLVNRIECQFDIEGTTYQETLSGMYRLFDASLARYELHIGTDAEPNIDSAPTETFTSLPHTTTTQLATNATSYLLLNQRNKYNMVSRNIRTTRIRVDGAGAQTNVPPSAPSVISWEATASGAFRLKAVYHYDLDASALQADTWLIYFTSNGVDPNPSSDTPTTQTIVKVDGAAFLDYTTATFAGGTTGKVLLRTRRSSDAVDSTNSNVYTATSDVAGPAAPEGGIFWRRSAEEHQ